MISDRERVSALRKLIFEHESASDFLPVPATVIDAVKQEFPGLPEHLVELMQQVGQGSIGEGRYMVSVPMTPASLYSRASPGALEHLKGLVIVGDDFASYKAAYDSRGESWIFGEISPSGRFEADTAHRDFIEFLRGWVLKKR